MAVRQRRRRAHRRRRGCDRPLGRRGVGAGVVHREDLALLLLDLGHGGVRRRVVQHLRHLHHAVQRSQKVVVVTHERIAADARVVDDPGLGRAAVDLAGTGPANMAHLLMSCGDRKAELSRAESAPASQVDVVPEAADLQQLGRRAVGLCDVIVHLHPDTSSVGCAGSALSEPSRRRTRKGCTPDRIVDPVEDSCRTYPSNMPKYRKISVKFPLDFSQNFVPGSALCW